MDPLWGTTDVSSKLEEGASREERELRSLALEKTYVHDVYQEIACHFTDTRYRAWPRVKQFLMDLEPGSILCDVGKWRGETSLSGPPTKPNCLKKTKLKTPTLSGERESR